MHLWVSVLGQSLPTYPFKLPSSHFAEEMHASVQPSPIIIVIRCSGLEKPVGRAKGQLETRHLGTRIPWVLCMLWGPARRWSQWWKQGAPALGGPHFQHLVKWVTTFHMTTHISSISDCGLPWGKVSLGKSKEDSKGYWKWRCLISPQPSFHGEALPYLLVLELQLVNKHVPETHIIILTNTF